MWNNINIQFGNVLRKVREARGLSQEEFAELCDISRAYYGRIERGEHSILLIYAIEFLRLRDYLCQNYF